jgi:hypothetical protein
VFNAVLLDVEEAADVVAKLLQDVVAVVIIQPVVPAK